MSAATSWTPSPADLPGLAGRIPQRAGHRTSSNGMRIFVCFPDNIYICVSKLILYYMKILDEQTIYQATDEQILGELHDRLVRMRRSCCFSQQELADLSGVSIATIKRIETQRDKDISLTVLIRLLRTMTQMEGIGTLVPEVPESPFLAMKDGTTARRVSSKRKRI